jgi:hypothetical protein
MSTVTEPLSTAELLAQAEKERDRVAWQHSHGNATFEAVKAAEAKVDALRNTLAVEDGLPAAAERGAADVAAAEQARQKRWVAAVPRIQEALAERMSAAIRVDHAVKELREAMVEWRSVFAPFSPMAPLLKDAPVDFRLLPKLKEPGYAAKNVVEAAIANPPRIAPSCVDALDAYATKIYAAVAPVDEEVRANRRARRSQKAGE